MQKGYAFVQVLCEVVSFWLMWCGLCSSGRVVNWYSSVMFDLNVVLSFCWELALSRQKTTTLQRIAQIHGLRSACHPSGPRPQSDPRPPCHLSGAPAQTVPAARPQCRAQPASACHPCHCGLRGPPVPICVPPIQTGAFPFSMRELQTLLPGG